MLALTACGGGDEASPTPTTPDTTAPVQVANPAAVYCEQQGGTVFGPEPMCGLPDGTTVDAWEFYRADSTGQPLPTTPPTAPTTSAPPPDPDTALAQLRESLGDVLAEPAVSDGPCGRYAVLMRPQQVTLHRWNVSKWVDVTDMLGGEGSGTIPVDVTAVELTGDGTADFVARFDSPEPNGSPYGAILVADEDGSPEGCTWGWASFFSQEVDPGTDPALAESPYTQTLDDLRWEDGVLRATYQRYRNPSDQAVATYNPGRSMFLVTWPQTTSTPAPPPPPPPRQDDGPVCPNYEYREYAPFEICTEGPGIVVLQRALVYFGYHDGSVDGYFGPGTEAAVRRAQAAYGVPQNGIVEGGWYYDLIETYNLMVSGDG